MPIQVNSEGINHIFKNTKSLKSSTNILILVKREHNMAFKTITKTYSIKTNRRLQFITITDKVEETIKESGIKTGLVVVQTHHTTFRIWVNEDEKNLVGHNEIDYEHDLMKVLDKFAHPNEEYKHNDVKDTRNPAGKRDTHLCEPDEEGICYECRNGHSHAQAMILPHSITMIIENGKLLKGHWQEIMVCELDHDRTRKYSILVQGNNK